LKTLFASLGLHTDSGKFVEALVGDEAASRRKRGKLILTRVNPGGIEPDYKAPMREYIRKLETEHPKARMMNQRELAESTLLRDAYLYFAHFSAIATHVSASSLGYHMKSETENEQIVRRIEVVPVPSTDDLAELFLEACHALIGVAITANELIGGTPAGLGLRAIFEEHHELQLNQIRTAPS
jgi:hypothetical protein